MLAVLLYWPADGSDVDGNVNHIWTDVELQGIVRRRVSGNSQLSKHVKQVELHCTRSLPTFTVTHRQSSDGSKCIQHTLTCVHTFLPFYHISLQLLFSATTFRLSQIIQNKNLGDACSKFLQARHPSWCSVYTVNALHGTYQPITDWVS